MIKTFKYMTDSKETYGVDVLGLKKGGTFKLIDKNLSYIEKTKDNILSTWHYEYLINIPNQGCHRICEEVWAELMADSEYIEN